MQIVSNSLTPFIPSSPSLHIISQKSFFFLHSIQRFNEIEPHGFQWFDSIQYGSGVPKHTRVYNWMSMSFRRRAVVSGLEHKQWHLTHSNCMAGLRIESIFDTFVAYHGTLTSISSDTRIFSLMDCLPCIRLDATIR